MSTLIDFRVITHMQMEDTGGELPEIRQIGSTIQLDERLSKEAYIEPDGMPTIDGAKVILTSHIAGIDSIIKYGHEQGWWKDYEQVKSTISVIAALFGEVSESGIAILSDDINDGVIEVIKK